MQVTFQVTARKRKDEYIATLKLTDEMEIVDYNEHDLTQSLSFAATVGCEESGGRHNFCTATSVSGAGTEQSEVLGELDSLV